MDLECEAYSSMGVKDLNDRMLAGCAINRACWGMRHNLTACRTLKLTQLVRPHIMSSEAGGLQVCRNNVSMFDATGKDKQAHEHHARGVRTKKRNPQQRTHVDTSNGKQVYMKGRTI